jgi:hypothetical protein
LNFTKPESDVSLRMATMRWRGWLIFALLVGSVQLVRGHDLDWRIVQPQTNSSPSGVHQLSMDPTEKYGKGPADYEFRSGGKLVWKQRLPLTLESAGVTEDGFVVGYGSPEGTMSGGDEPNDTLDLVGLSSDGKFVFRRRLARKFYGGGGVSAQPNCSGIVVSESKGLCTFRLDIVTNRWPTIQFRSGKPKRQVQRFEPTGESWRVVSGADRAHVDSETETETQWNDIQKIELRKLGEISLQVFQVGDAPESRILSKIHKPNPELFHVGPSNRVYIAHVPSQSVQVFEPDGSFAGSCRPKLDDLDGQSRLTHIAVSRRGKSLLWLDDEYSRLLEFDSRQRRVGWVKAMLFGEWREETEAKWHFQPNTSRHWIVEYDSVYLMKGQETLQKIERRMDRRWLNLTGPANVGRDGSLAVISITPGRRMGDAKHWVNVFDSEGGAKAVFPCPADAASGPVTCLRERIIVGSLREGRYHVFSRSGKHQGGISTDRLKIPDQLSRPAAAMNGTEIWFLALRNMKIYRYALP